MRGIVIIRKALIKACEEFKYKFFDRIENVYFCSSFINDLKYKDNLMTLFYEIKKNFLARQEELKRKAEEITLNRSNQIVDKLDNLDLNNKVEKHTDNKLCNLSASSIGTNKKKERLCCDIKQRSFVNLELASKSLQKEKQSKDCNDYDSDTEDKELFLILNQSTITKNAENNIQNINCKKLSEENHNFDVSSIHSIKQEPLIDESHKIDHENLNYKNPKIEKKSKRSTLTANSTTTNNTINSTYVQNFNNFNHINSINNQYHSQCINSNTFPNGLNNNFNYNLNNAYIQQKVFTENYLNNTSVFNKIPVLQNSINQYNTNIGINNNYYCYNTNFANNINIYNQQYANQLGNQIIQPSYTNQYCNVMNPYLSRQLQSNPQISNFNEQRYHLGNYVPNFPLNINSINSNKNIFLKKN